MRDARPETGGYRSGARNIFEKNPLVAITGEDAASSRLALENGPAEASWEPEAATEDGLPSESPPGVDEKRVPLVDRLPFNLTVAALTFLNILVLGLEQDLGPTKGGLVGRLGWYALECFFCLSFAVEIVLRMYFATEKLVDWLADLWNFFDCCLVAAAVLDAFVLVPVGVGGAVRFFTVLRALRVVRLVRLVRMFPVFRELWLLVGGLANSIKALGWVSLIVVLVLYVCAIVVTTQIGQNPEVYGAGPSYDGEIWPYEKYFGDIPSSMFTLLQVMTLDAWCDDIVRHVVYRQPFMGLFFVAFLLVTAFGLMNIVVGIIVENTLAAAQVADRRVEDHDAYMRKWAVERLADILVKSDTRRTGQISLKELQGSRENPIVQDLFKKIGLTWEDAEKIFNLLDYERGGRVELKRFANSCRELVGGPRRRDIAQVEITVGALARQLEHLDGQFSRMHNEVNNLTAMADDFTKRTVRMLTGFNGNQAMPTRPVRTDGNLRRQ